MKKYFTINFIHLIHKHVRFYLPLPTSVTVSIFTFSAFIFPHSLLTFPSSSLSSHNKSSLVPSTALDIKHFLKPFTVTSDEMCCDAIMSHWQRRVTLGFLILPAGVKAWSLVKSHSLHSCFWWSVNGLFITTFSTYSCVIFLPGTTKTPVCMVLPIIVAFTSGARSLKWIQNQHPQGCSVLCH